MSGFYIRWQYHNEVRVMYGMRPSDPDPIFNPSGTDARTYDPRHLSHIPRYLSEMQQNVTTSNESESLSDSPGAAAGSTGVKREVDSGNERIDRMKPTEGVV